MKKNFVYLTVLAYVIHTLSGCTPATAPVSVSGIYCDTIINIDIYGAGKDSQTICDNCRNMCEHYQNLFDKNNPVSDIYAVNHSDSGKVSVDHDTALLLGKALVYSEKSDGLFDITIAPVSSLWDFHEENAHIPGDHEIMAALPLVDYTALSADPGNNTVTLKKGMSIDPGGVAKGYIADRIAEYLLSCSITGAIINMGGDIRVIGTKPDNSMFSIGINDPFKDGTIGMALGISDMSVATSGIYERCFTSEGRTYHHILDPSTGYPVDTDIESVTVITESATDADCLCTLCILYGSEKAMELIENTEDTEAVMILTDNTMLTSSGASRFIRQ